MSRTIMVGAALAVFIAIYIAALSPSLREKQQRDEAAANAAAKQATSTPSSSSATKKAHPTASSTPKSDSENDSSAPNATKLEQAVAAVAQFYEAMDKTMDGELKKSVTFRHVSEEAVAGEEEHDAASLFSNLRTSAARDFKAGEIVLPLPVKLLFGEMTADMYLKRGLDELLAANPSLGETFGVTIDEKTQRPSASGLRTEWLVVMNLLLQMQAPSQSRWSSYLSTLPSGKFMVDTFPLYATEEERLLCLSGADLRYLSALSEQLRLLIDATHEVCEATVPRMPGKAGADNAVEPPVRVGAQRVHDFTCHISDENIQWAFAVFVSRHVSLGPDPVLFPVLDAIPYATDANLRPGELRTDDEGRIVDVTIVAAKDIRKGERLSYRAALRTPWSVFGDRGAHSLLTYNGSLPIPFSWSVAQPDEEDVAPGNDVCRNDAAGSAISLDGSVAPLFWQCAERELALRTARAAASSSNESGDEQELPKSAFELVVQRLEGDSEVVDKSCKPCEGLTGLSQRRCVGMRRHTTFVRGVVEKFKAKGDLAASRVA